MDCVLLGELVPVTVIVCVRVVVSLEDWEIEAVPDVLQVCVALGVSVTLGV